MRKVNVINGYSEHNAHITARPAILFPATGQENDGLVIQMGTEGPRVLDFQKEGLPKYVEWGLEFETVREFTRAFVQVGSPEHRELEANTSKKDRETCKGLLQLRATHATSPFPLEVKAAKRELASAGSKLIEDPRVQATFGGGQLPKVAAWFYPAFFNRELKRVRLVLWLTKQNQFLPAILCPDMTTAMFASAAFGQIVACLNCSRIFALDSEHVDGSKGDRYCTAACGQRYRQKVYRLRAKEAKKKRSRAASKR